ncbi:hypothetical protein ACJRO7_019873 [Eucalyptus globulus]|uniref:Uncharacterized protein n=1 Tax=Eucalyptus globulus TaxID=34317 RepID=A0ABD3KGD4_EUCGL
MMGKRSYTLVMMGDDDKMQAAMGKAGRSCIVGARPQDYGTTGPAKLLSWRRRSDRLKSLRRKAVLLEIGPDAPRSGRTVGRG